MEVKSTWREFEVSIVKGIDRPYVIDESMRELKIRRCVLKPWRMLAALIEAMNELAALDAQWACRMNGKGIFMSDQFVKIAGEDWRISACPLVGEKTADGKGIDMMPYKLDFDDRTIRINSRFNAGFSGASIVQLVANISADRFAEKLEDLREATEAAV